MVVSASFYLRNNRNPTPRSASGEVPWRLHMWVLFTASMLIMVRSVFRVIEYVQGTDGYLLTHEIYLYIFDAALMCGVVIIFNIVHPSQITGFVTGQAAVYLVWKRENSNPLKGTGADEENMTGMHENLRMQSIAARA